MYIHRGIKLVGQLAMHVMNLHINKIFEKQNMFIIKYTVSLDHIQNGGRRQATCTHCFKQQNNFINQNKFIKIYSFIKHC